MLPRCIHMLSPFNLFTTNDDVQLVPHNSFILHNSVIHKFLQFTKNFILIQKADSQFAERYLGYIIYSLNDNNTFTIETEFPYLYDVFTVNLFEPVNKHFFVKKVYNKL